MDFTGRNVLVTGGANGIGLAMTQAFLEKGARVAMVDCNRQKGEQSERMLRETYQDIHFIHADVGDYQSCVQAVAAAEKLLGDIDTLVNNAGISPKRDGQGLPIDELSIEEWTRVCDVNLHGAFYFSKLVSAKMKKNRFGRIVSVSSVAGKTFLGLCAVHYATTKAGIIGLTKHLAGELGPYGINVNAVAPGRIDTDMVAMAGPAANQVFVEQTPLKRLGTTQEVADLCLYLASEKEAGFVTGQVVDVSGGWLMT